jgi:palmitoyltransferase
MFFTTNIFFVASWRKDPGYLKPVQGLDFVKLVEKAKDAEHLCPTCQVIRTPTSRHCFKCNKCIDRYDHHCVWINNCVGRANHNLFYLFIISLEAYLVLIILTGICSK